MLVVPCGEVGLTCRERLAQEVEERVGRLFFGGLNDARLELDLAGLREGHGPYRTDDAVLVNGADGIHEIIPRP